MNIALRSFAFACVLAAAAATAHGDARLNDVAIVDSDSAWAVGDRGIVLHSSDGGQSWREQATSVDARLTGVSFISPQFGWAVGGRTRPHTLQSQGVVLATNDGGASWRELPARNLPALACVEFFDSAHGVAVGRASSMQASGVFVTQDGGQSWQAVAGGGGWSWQAGDFVSPFTGSVAGRGLWAGVDRRAIAAADGESPRIRAIRDLVLVPPTGGWATGDGGLLLTTPDLGRSWFATPSPLPDFAARHFDLAAIAVHGDHVWAAGAPGSRVFHSPDAGQSWQGFATGLTTPLTSLEFIDDLRGVAVGDLGVVLTTDDGGQTWQLRRRGGSRTPLLVVAAHEESVPLEVLAATSADDGYLAAVDVLLRPPVEDTTTRPTPHALINTAADDVDARLQEAVLTVGGTTSHRAWRFPTALGAGLQAPTDRLIPPKRPTEGLPNVRKTSTQPVSSAIAEILADLDRQTDGRTLELLESHLVRQIRMWRPDILVVGASPTGPTPEGALTREVVLRSIAAAADPTQQIDLAANADLSAWQVKRVFAVAPEAIANGVSIATTTFSTRLGATIGQVADEARSILSPSSNAALATVAIHHLVPPQSSKLSLRSLFDGIELTPGSDGRRAPRRLNDADVQLATATAEKRRNVQAILATQGGNAALVSHVETLTDGLDAASKARVLYDLAGDYRTSGQLQLASRMLERLVREHGESDLVDAALVWLIQYHASSEGPSISSPTSATQSITLPSPPPPRWGMGPGGGGDARRGGSEHPAIAIARLAADLRPNLLAEPHVGFPLAAAYRRAGLPKESDRYMLLLRQRGADDAWRQLALAEKWLAEPTEEPPVLPIWTCRRTTERPHLDGMLDEPFWRSVRPAILWTNDLDTNLNSQTNLNDQVANQQRADVRLAYDDEFLFLSIASPSRSIPTHNPSPSPSMAEARGGGERTTKNPNDNIQPTRRRDEDLAGADRISLAIDLDRDLTTYYEFAVDSLGRAHESAWHDAQWNPTRYIANENDPTGWTIEAAIPLAELSATPPQSRDVWCIAASRMEPDGRTTSWHGPAAMTFSAASFGLLLFE